jgi:hypothetical protein
VTLLTYKSYYFFTCSGDYDPEISNLIFIRVTSLNLTIYSLFGGERNFEYASWDCTKKYRVSFLIHKFVANMRNYQKKFILKENSVFGKGADGHCRVAKFQPHFLVENKLDV